ncbi:sulfatase-like hydrolase/transferase [uncultured Alsobacter sp.]|uniref:sulfatase-like hydrolase/transferase n=1 Tax=uncultured Alsobacter sp. TaxID=1748258 RepID=UPI0025E0D57B|nr:sulfatase-like hydrolase/transferase [uncultured Alsobacter sp.]
MRKPNVIVFFTDQQRFDTVGVHGNPMGLTPNFDRYARQGTHLFNAITVQPLCGPARSCMQTGRFATQTGCWRNHIPLAQDAETLARVFNKGGYHTGYIGKWHLGSDDPVKAPERGGYQSWLGANLLEFSSDAYDCLLWDEENRRRKLPGYRVDALTDAAIRFVDTHQQEPFFLFMSFLEPHHQNHLDNYPPPRGRGLDSGHWVPPDLVALQGTSPQHLPGYYGMVRRLDEAFGRLMDALISLDLLDNTIVLFTSDHGCHFKTRNGEYKRSCHESSVRVPTLITGPGFVGGGEVRHLFGTIDVAPTLIDAAGLEVPASMMGRSILPVVRDKTAPWRDDILIQISESQTARAIRSARWKYSVTAPYDEAAQDAASYREEYLYDLDNDPYELVNLAGMSTFRGVADNMKGRLLDWIDRVEGKRPTIEDMAGTDPLQLIAAKGDGVAADRQGIDPYRSPLLKF